MPCQDSYNQDRDYCPSNDSFEIERLRDRLDKVAAMLCEVMQIVEENSMMDSQDVTYERLMCNAQLNEWWTKHKEYDKNRK